MLLLYLGVVTCTPGDTCPLDASKLEIFSQARSLSNPSLFHQMVQQVKGNYEAILDAMPLDYKRTILADSAIMARQENLIEALHLLVVSVQSDNSILSAENSAFSASLQSATSSATTVTTTISTASPSETACVNPADNKIHCIN